LSYAPSRTQRTNKKAIWRLFLSFIWLGGLGSVAGIWLRIVARRDIVGTRERGSRLPIAGITADLGAPVTSGQYPMRIKRSFGVRAPEEAHDDPRSVFAGLRAGSRRHE
jgi:hypothetical protein